MKKVYKKYANGSSGVGIPELMIDPPKKVTKNLNDDQVADINKDKSFGGLEITPEFGKSGYFITEEEQAKLDAAKKQAELEKLYNPTRDGVVDITKEKNRYLKGGVGMIVGDSYKIWNKDPSSFLTNKKTPQEGQDFVYYSPKQYKDFQNSDIYKQKYPEEFTPQYANGTGISGTGEIVDPNQTLAEFQQLLDTSKATGESNVWATALPIVASIATSFAGKGSNSASATAALGGNNMQGQIEVEGDEIVEEPSGAPVEVKGPSHEQGGVNIDVEPGTKIYSDRIKIGGKTMAERKKARESLLLNLDKTSSTRQGDEATKNSVNRMRINIEKEEESDLMVQELANSFQKLSHQYANGTGGIGVQFPSTEEEQLPISTFLNNFNTNLPVNSINSLQPVGTTYDQSLGKEEEAFFNTQVPVNNTSFTENSEASTASTGYTPTAGDITSLFGNLVSTFGPMNNTKANRAGDTPNINAYKDFGKDALDTNQNILGLVKSQGANSATNLRRKAISTKMSARNSSRSVNTQRATDTLVDLETNNQQLNVDDNLSRQMMQILGNQANLENARDQVVMGGEQQRDLADRQDRDNFYTQMAQDIATKGQGIQTIGKDLNSMSENEMYMKMLNQMSKYFQFDSSGNIIGINQVKK